MEVIKMRRISITTLFQEKLTQLIAFTKIEFQFQGLVFLGIQSSDFGINQDQYCHMHLLRKNWNIWFPE